jgi:ectoine hydroxylase-related dioxygenase (phytanoyl-CoA dioxygenase family)
VRLAYGRRSFAFQTLSFRSGSQQGLHSDTVHFDSDPPGFMCGVWIALEDVSEDSGPLVYYPGSHRLPVMTMAGAGVSGIPAAADYATFYEPNFRAAVEQSGLPERRLIIPKGWAFVWDANLAHGGAPITGRGTTRHSLVVHCYLEECVYYTPMRSDERRGHRHIRLPTDIGTGRVVWPRTAGRRVWPSALTILKAYGRRIYGQPIVT